MSTEQKTILLTGATDGIGLETAKMLASGGHNVLLHGRSQAKLEHLESTLSAMAIHGQIESYVADLSRMADVEALANGCVGQQLQHRARFHAGPGQIEHREQRPGHHVARCQWPVGDGVGDVQRVARVDPEDRIDQRPG